MRKNYEIAITRKLLAFILFLAIIAVIYWVVKQVPILDFGKSSNSAKKALESTPSAVRQAESFNLNQKVTEAITKNTEEIVGRITKVEGNRISIDDKDYILSPTVQVFEVKGSPTLSREEIMEKKVPKPMDTSQFKLGDQVNGYFIKEMSKDEISILIIFQ